MPRTRDHVSSDEHICHSVEVAKPEELTPLGRRIETERIKLDLSKPDVGGHWETYEKIVTGRNVERRTIRRAFTRLGWDPDSLDDVIAGGDPRPLQATSKPLAAPESDIVVVIERMGEYVEGVAGLTDEEWQVVRMYVDRGKRRLRERASGDNNV